MQAQPGRLNLHPTCVQKEKNQPPRREDAKKEKAFLLFLASLRLGGPYP
jgi:hypothetical protein